MNDDIKKSFPMTWEQAVQWLREQPEQQELVKDCFFDDPLPEAAERFYKSAEWVETRKSLPPLPGKALDLGAGRGISSYALAKDGFEVTALEPDPSSLVGAGAIQSLVEEAGLPITVVQEWGERLPFDDHSFDVVYGRQVLHHARSLPDLCREAARVLKPGGVFIATREHVVDEPEDLPIFLEGHPLHRFYGGEHAFSLPQYISAFEDAGLCFREILAPFDSIINYFPLSEAQARDQLATLWRWPHPPADIQLVDNSRLCLCFPGRLFTFIAWAPQATAPNHEQQPVARLLAMESRLVSQRALNDNLHAKLVATRQRLERTDQWMAEADQWMAETDQRLGETNQQLEDISHRLEKKRPQFKRN